MSFFGYDIYIHEICIYIYIYMIDILWYEILGMETTQRIKTSRSLASLDNFGDVSPESAGSPSASPKVGARSGRSVARPCSVSFLMCLMCFFDCFFVFQMLFSFSFNVVFCSQQPCFRNISYFSDACCVFSFLKMCFIAKERSELVVDV